LRSILREEVFGARKTLKRLDHMNPSVGIDRMKDYQAIYNKMLQNLSFLSVHVFTFVGSRPPQHSWPAATTLNRDEMLSFGWMIDQDLANTFYLSPQVISSLWTQHPSSQATKLQFNMVFWL
jgi:hypothetical protein